MILYPQVIIFAMSNICILQVIYIHELLLTAKLLLGDMILLVGGDEIFLAGIKYFSKKLLLGIVMAPESFCRNVIYVGMFHFVQFFFSISSLTQKIWLA